MDARLQQLLDAVLALLAGLTPAALGAFVSLAFERGLSWTERFLQFTVGVIVSYFFGRAIGALRAFDPFVLQAITFSIGMIAFKATPKMIESVVDAISRFAPEALDRLLSWIPRKDRTP